MVGSYFQTFSLALGALTHTPSHFLALSTENVVRKLFVFYTFNKAYLLKLSLLLTES